MLPLLHTLVSSTTKHNLTWEYITDPRLYPNFRSNFEIKYGGLPTSFAGWGWWPIFKVDNGPEVRILGTKNGTANYNDIFISTEITRPYGLNFLLIQFIAKNNGSYPHKVSIASRTDISTGVSDTAPVYWYDGNRGLIIDGHVLFNQDVRHILIVRDGYGVTNVDDFWFGYNTVANLHYWDNRTEASNFTDGMDSAFSFAWRDREIYPNETLAFGVLYGQDEGLAHPPIINAHLSTMNYSPNSTVKIPVNIKDFDKNDNVTLYYNFTKNNINETRKYDTINTGNGLNKNIDVIVTLGSEVGKYPLKIWAEDGNGFKSNEFNANLLVDEAPVLTITNQIKSRYYKNGAIEVQGTIWDETYAYIWYQIDNSYKFSPKEAVHCNKRQVPFRQVLAIQDKSIEVGDHEHVLKIWAVDEFGSVSQMFTHNFTYVDQHIPEIRIIQNETKTYSENDLIQVFGEVRDLDSFGLLSIHYFPANAEASEEFQFVQYVEATYEWSNFSFIYQIPKMRPGHKHLTFKVIDNTDANSFYAYYNFTYKTNGTDDEITTTTNNAAQIEGEGQKIETTNVPPEKKKTNIVLIAALASSAVLIVVIAIAVYIIYREAKKEPETFSYENGEFVGNIGGGGDIETDNPLYGHAQDADPFQNDFELSESSSVFLASTSA